MDVLINIKDLKKAFGKKEVFRNVNLEIKQGELFGVIGMSGSGKTTLLNLIIGFFTPDSGDVLFYSFEDKQYKSVYRNQQEVKKNFGFATQVPSFHPKLTLKENLRYFGRLHKLSERVIKNNSKHLLELTSLEDAKDQLADEISEGMKKRLDIACSLIHNPRILLMDEPTADLDPVLRKETWKLIKGIKRTGTTIIIASHILSDLEYTCDRLGIIRNKKIDIKGTPEQIKEKYSKEIEEIYLESIPGKYDILAKKLGSDKKLNIHSMDIVNGTMIIRTSNAKLTVNKLMHLINDSNENIINIEIKKPSLAEVFESLYKKEKNND